MRKVAANIHLKLKDYFFILSGLVSSLVLLATPLQQFVPLGRYQHYGLCVFTLGMGYVLQVVWSWRHLSRCPRLGYLVTGLYLTSVGVVLYSNPWLDSRVAIMTEEKENIRALIGLVYTALALPLAFIYIGWMYEDHKARKRKDETP